MTHQALDRRHFLSFFSSIGLSGTLLPGVLWARVQDGDKSEVTAAMVKQAAALAGLEVTDEQAQSMAEGATRNLAGYAALRTYQLDHTMAPVIYFNPLVPGMEVDRSNRAFRMSRPVGLMRPANLEEAAFWSLAALGELIRTRQVSSLELTEMYLARLERYQPRLNFLVTLTGELARKQAERADRELRSGQYRGPLHGIPWGAKDILAVKDYPTTWGSNPFRNQVTEYEATVVERLREAGAVLVAKLSTGELASGDRWFGGRTRNPWNSEMGSSGSSAGPASATVAGSVGFAIGTETTGSILSPSVACGATGLRPTYGRVSRFGAMALRWTGDRLGPICRTVEDCALVLRAICGPDVRDPSVLDIPFNWDVEGDATRYRVAYLQDAFEEDSSRRDDWLLNDRRALSHLRSIGFDLHPIKTPLADFSIDALRALSAESSAAFEGFLRDGRDAEMSRPERADGWRRGFTVPAFEYIQAQRVRGIMMKELHQALGEYDVYLAPYMDSRRYLTGEERATGDGKSHTSRFFQLANIASYPAVAVRHGFGAGGLPTGVTFVGRPFAEEKVLSVARVYQESTDFHLKRPTLDK